MQIPPPKNKLPLIIVVVFCLSLLSACGQVVQPDASASAGDAAIDAALVHYDAENYTAAITQLTAFKNTYPNSPYLDEAQYFIGRSTHELAYLESIAPTATLNYPYTFDAARAEYAKLINDPINNARKWADDAQYQIGSTYFDQLSYLPALEAFEKVLAYTAPSAGYSAQYYKARAIHALAKIEQAALQPTPSYPYTYDLARAEYTKLLSPSANARSDDAQYQIGMAHFDEGMGKAPNSAEDLALAMAAFDKVFAYTETPLAADAQFYKARATHGWAVALPNAPANFDLARAEYALVKNHPPNNWLDDAAYQSALTYDDAEDCAAELGAMEQFVLDYSSPQTPTPSPFLADAQKHIADLNLALATPPGDFKDHKKCPRPV